MLSPIKEIFNVAVPVLENVPVLRAIIGIALVFFLPGFAWTLILLKRINVVERVAFSIGLSVAIVTLGVLFSAVILGIEITGLNALAVIFVLTASPIAIFYIGKSLPRRERALSDIPRDPAGCNKNLTKKDY